MKKLNLLMLVAAFVFLFSTNARAEIFFAYLNGAQQVPPAATTATGYARVFVNESAGTLSFTVVFNNLGSNQTLSHIHAPAPIGGNAAVIIDFGAVGGTSGTISGSTTITPGQLAQLRAHQGYVNVHSVNFPNGEIRGQLGPKRPVDFDGDGRQDLSVLQFPSSGDPRPITYLNLNSTTGLFVSGVWGNALTDFPAPGDYDGDGKDDLAYFRTNPGAGSQSEYFILRSGTGTLQYYAWGVNGDASVARDYDGDGITDVAVYREGAGPTDPATWFIRNSATGTVRGVTWGLTGDGTNNFDNPVPCDYDGDGKYDIATYRFGMPTPNTYYVLRSSDGAVTHQTWGNFNSDWILPGDYDGDGKCDYGVARTGPLATSPAVWWILNSSGGSTTRTFGISTDFPVQGDYDGDARTDMAWWRPGATAGAPANFWIFNSLTNTSNVFTWGTSANFAIARFDSR